MASTADILQVQVLKMDAKFQKACEQVLVLNNMMKELQIRYDRAARDNLRTYRYALRLRLCTVEGLRNTLYDYVTQKADDIEQMEEEMRNLGAEPIIIYDVDSDSESDTHPTEINQIVLPSQWSFSGPVYINKR